MFALPGFLLFSKKDANGHPSAGGGPFLVPLSSDAVASGAIAYPTRYDSIECLSRSQNVVLETILGLVEIVKSWPAHDAAVGLQRIRSVLSSQDGEFAPDGVEESGSRP